jgi:hypothetical protein
MVASQARLIRSGLVPQRLSLLAGWLIGAVAFGSFCVPSLLQTAAAADAATPSAAATAAAAAPNEPQYAQMPLDEDIKNRRAQVHSEVVSILRRSSSKFASDAEKKTVEDYYKTYALPRWTQVEYAAPRFARPEVETLPAFHKELRRDLVSTKGDVHEYLNAMVLEFMGNIISGNYHPFAQVNAALMIGELDGEPAANATKPYAKALPVLIRIVEDPKQRDAVHAAAMVGILRHVEAGLGDDAPRSALTAAMLKLLTSEISSPLTVQGQVWIRGQAIETLGWLGSAGENGEVFKAILASLGDANLNALVGAELSYTTRCIAAKALGRLNYNAARGINAADAARMLGQLCVQVCDAGLRATRTRGDPNIGRRALTARLGSILAALKGISDTQKGIVSAADAEQKDSLTELQTFLEDTMEILNSRRSDLADVETAARKLRENVSDWLQKEST